MEKTPKQFISDKAKEILSILAPDDAEVVNSYISSRVDEARDSVNLSSKIVEVVSAFSGGGLGVAGAVCITVLMVKSCSLDATEEDVRREVNLRLETEHGEKVQSLTQENVLLKRQVNTYPMIDALVRDMCDRKSPVNPSPSTTPSE